MRRVTGRETGWVLLTNQKFTHGGFRTCIQIINLGETVEDFMTKVLKPMEAGQEIRGNKWKLATMEPPKDKAPKKLGQRSWLQQVQKYEAAYVSKRAFPQKIVAEAEEVLARLMWEHEVSKVYTALGPGEVIATRSYNSCGNVNRHAQKNEGKRSWNSTKVIVRQSTWSRRRRLCTWDRKI